MDKKIHAASGHTLQERMHVKSNGYAMVPGDLYALIKKETGEIIGVFPGDNGSGSMNISWLKLLPSYVSYIVTILPEAQITISFPFEHFNFVPLNVRKIFFPVFAGRMIIKGIKSNTVYIHKAFTG